MRRKKTCAVLLSVVFLLTALLPFSIIAKADPASAGSSVANRMERVLKEYPEGTKWTGGGQCYGFAKFVVNQVFGKANGNERGWWDWVKEQKNSNLTGMKIVGNVLNKGFGRQELYDLLLLAKPGDVIQCTGDGDAKGHVLHSMIVYSVKINQKDPKSSKIIIYDNNWGPNNNVVQLRGEKTFQEYYSEVKNRGKLALLRADNYDAIDQKTFLFVDEHTTIAVGNKKTLQVAISPAQAYQAYQQSLQWSSSDPSVAAVDASGKIAAVKAGSVKITVKTSDGSCSAACKVNVVNLNKPSSLDVSGDDSAIKISWKKVPEKIEVSKNDVYSFKGYTLQRRETGGEWTNLETLEKVSYTDKTAEGGKIYEYRVRAKYTHTYSAKKGTLSESVWGPWQNSSPTGNGPVPPKNISLRGEKNGITVQWSASKNATKYAVLRKTGTEDWEVLAYISDESYLDSTAKTGSTYQYAIRAQGGVGWGIASFSASITYTAAPELSSVSSADGGVQIQWKKVPGAEKYRVFRKEGSEGWKKIGDTVELIYMDKTAKFGKTYSYTVRCITLDGKNYTSHYDAIGKKITVK